MNASALKIVEEYLAFFDSHYRKVDWPFFDPNGLLPSWHMLSEIHTLPRTARILVIGDYSMRDTTLLEALGFSPDMVDLDRPPGSDKLRGKFIKVNLDDREQHNKIEDRYDAIIFCEVSEHLFNDCQALTFLCSRLKPEGVLIFSTPLVNPLLTNASDKADFHVQVYTPKQLERLFGNAGLSASRFVIRGALCNWWYSLPVRGFVWGLRKSFGERKAFQVVLEITRQLHHAGNNCGSFKRLSKWSWAYGCLAVLKPSVSKVDFDELNRKEFLTTR